MLGYGCGLVLDIQAKQMQIKKQEMPHKNRFIMAHNQRSLKESVKAWRTFEDALKNLDSFEQCAKWVIDHPEVCKKLSGMGLLAVMKEDLKKEA